MHELTYSIDRDLEEAKSIADHLVPYVYEDQLYGTVAGMFGSQSMPSLTIGMLLLRLHRLHAFESQLSADQKAQLAVIDAQNEAVHKEWTVHYNDKLIQEANSRLAMIERYFSDCEEDPRTCASNYIPEATRRTIVKDIANALQRYDAVNTELNSVTVRVDSMLRRGLSRLCLFQADGYLPGRCQSRSLS